MENIPPYISGTFIAIVIASIGFIFYAVNHVAQGKRNFTPVFLLSGFLVWITFISILTLNDYFKDFSSPRLFPFVGVPIVIMVFLLGYRRTRSFLNKMPITTLTYVHIIRVPVEMVLLWLGISGAISMELTFEGSNFDILSGITAPFVAVFLIGKNKNKLGAIIWNLFALGLLINIVYNAISQTPYFLDPTSTNEIVNIAVFHFPFVLLPTIVVPIVFFSHVVSLNQLIFTKDQSQF